MPTIAALGKDTLLKMPVNVSIASSRPTSTAGTPGAAWMTRTLLVAGAGVRSSMKGTTRKAVSPEAPSRPTAATVATCPPVSAGRFTSGRPPSAVSQFAEPGATRRATYAPAGTER